jgi:hypothetical protein
MESAIRLYAWNLKYAAALVGDLSPAQCTESGGPGLENHPAWTIGHLVSASDMLAEDLGLERNLPEGWQELFERRGPGDPRLPTDDQDDYPAMDTLLAELERQHVRVEAAWREKLADGSELDAPIEWRFHNDLPTLGDAVLFCAVSHEAMHLAQLAAWHRSRGLPSALATL